MSHKYISNFTGAEIEAILNNSDSLYDINVSASGTFTTSSTTVPADSTRSEAEGYWNGYLLVPIEGNALGEVREIISFTAGTGVFTIESTAFTSATGLVNYFIIKPEFYELFQRYVDDIVGDRAYTEDNYVTDEESLTDSIDALDVEIKDVNERQGDLDYTEDNYVADLASHTTNIDALDIEVKDVNDRQGDLQYTEQNYVTTDDDHTSNIDALDKQLLIASTALDEDTATLYSVRLVQVDGKPVLRTEEVV